MNDQEKAVVQEHIRKIRVATHSGSIDLPAVDASLKALESAANTHPDAQREIDEIDRKAQAEHDKIDRQADEAKDAVSKKFAEAANKPDDKAAAKAA